MKKLLTNLILLYFSIGLSQAFTPKQIDKFEKWVIVTDNINWNDQQVQTDFNTMLKKHRKHKRSKVWGIVLASLSAATITGGILIVTESKGSSDPNDFNEADGYVDAIGSVIIALGVAQGGISIPCFISSRTKRRERDSLIEQYSSAEAMHQSPDQKIPTYHN